MPSELLNWVHSFLEQDEDIIVPIKKMWNEWHRSHAEPSLDDFTTMLLGDDLIEEMEGVDHTEGYEWMDPEELDEFMQDMEAIGYYSGPRIKLKSRELTLEHISHMLKKHNDRMELSLRQAHASMPDDVSEEEEGQLIDIMVMAAEFRRHLRKAGLEPPDPDEE